MEKHEIIIVGGSCAGATAGHILAKAGRRPLIIEKDRFPREKLCGGMITEKTLSLLRDVYGRSPHEEIINSSCTAYEIHHADMGEICTFRHPSKRLYFIERKTFDNALLERAKAAGCAVMSSRRVTSVRGSNVRLDSGEELFADVIIGADGAHSVVRRSIAPSTRQGRFALGVQIDVEYAKLACFGHGQEISPRIYFGFMNHGYGWVFPKKGHAVVGLGGLTGTNTRNVKDLFENFLKSVMAGDIRQVMNQVQGFPIPFHNIIRTPGGGNVLLIGDAAGLVEPLTGEGIYFAILSGKLAAEAILAKGEYARTYSRTVRREIHRLFRQANFLKPVFFHPKVLSYAMRKMKRNGKYCKYYYDVLSGDMDYRQYFKTVLRDRNVYPSG